MDVHQLALLARQPSAALSERPRFCGMPKRGLALILANALFWQPLLVRAEGIVVSNPNTSLGQAGNGVPVVNIAAPNGAGLSHNQFQQYNVDSRGVILNNATTQTQNTQLGGIIVGYSNLQGRAAAIILNEVTGANASQLNGYTEVAGQSARVIVANPHGISCNGCGFINTPQVTLTTGKPVLDGNGQLSRFNVQGGSVSIDGAGLNAGNVDQFDIITRSAKINAELYANKLNVITGRNDVEANTLNATPLADDGSAKPELAIDSSALGGMYAGAVKLVGTEAGVGVKLAGNLAASAGDIQIDANGKLTMAQTAASGAIVARAGDIEVNGPAYAGSSATMISAGNLTVRKDLAARDSISLSSSGQLTNSAVIEAGINADKSRNTAGDATLSAGSLTNTGSVTASRNLQASATGTLTNQGATLGGQSNTIVTANTLDNRQSGRILSQNGSVNITASQVFNTNAGLISSSGNLTLTADTLDNSQQGTLSSSNVLSAQVGGELLNRMGLISTANNLQLNAGALDNRLAGRIDAKGVTVTTGAFNNAQGGELTSSGALNLTAGQVDNRDAGRIASALGLNAVVTGLDQTGGGRVYGNGDVSLDLNHGVLNNQGGLISAPGQLLLKNLAEVNNRSGEVSSAKAFTLTARSLDNTDGSVLSDAALIVRVDQVLDNLRGLVSGNGLELRAATLINREAEISSLGTLTANVGQFDNSGKGRLLANGALLLDASALDNRNAGSVSGQQGVQLNLGQLNNADSGGVYGKTGLRVDVATTLNNDRGVLRSDGALNLRAASLGNSGGSITSSGAGTINVGGSLVNQGGEILSDVDLTLQSGALDNSRNGRIAGKGLTVVTGNLDNSQGGRLTSTGALYLTAGHVDNSTAGRIASAQALTAVVTGLDQTGDGRLYGNGDVSLDLNHGVLDNQGGLISAPGQLLLKNLATVNNQRGEISSANGYTLAAASLNNTEGSVLSDQSLSIKVDHLLTNLRGLVSAKGVDLTAGELNNTHGSVDSAADLSIVAKGSLGNQSGELTSAGTSTLTAMSLSNADGQIMADRFLNMLVTGAIENQSGTLGAGQGLSIKAASLDNRDGTLVTDGDADLVMTAGVDNRQGVLQTKGRVDIAGLDLNNQGGMISAQTGMRLRVDSLDNSQTGLSGAEKGSIVSKAELDLVGKRLDNRSGLLNSVGVMRIETLAALNDNGRIASQSELTATVDSLTQQGGELVATGNLTLSGKTLDNRANALVGTTKALKLTVDDVDNRGGEISSQSSLDLVGSTLDNSDGGKVLAGTALGLAVTDVINRNKGRLFGESTRLAGVSLDNTGGSFVAQKDLDVDLSGALHNDTGLLSSEGALSVKAQSLSNVQGSLSSAADLRVTTEGALTNRQGSIVTDAALTVSSGSLDNSDKGALSGKGATEVRTGLFDNSQGGRLTSNETLLLTAGKVINQNAGRIASALALTAGVTSLDQQGGELFSNTSLSLDLNNGQLDNEGGLINAPGALLLKNLRGVNNRNGEISSEQSFELIAETVDNSSGKLLGNQMLRLVVDKALVNLKGTISAAALNSASQSLDNTEGLISSRGALDLTVGTELANTDGTVIADNELRLHAVSVDNTGGQIASKRNLTAEVGSLHQLGGELVAQGSLRLSGDMLVNGDDGFVGASQALDLTVAHVDNRGGEISSQDVVTLTGQQLDNGGNGLVLAQQALNLNVAQVANRAGTLSSKTGLTLVGTALDNTGGSLSALQGMTIDLSAALDNQRGLISSEQALNVQAASLNNSSGSISSAGDLALDTTGALTNNSGSLVTDGVLTLQSASLTNRQNGIISGKALLTLRTGDFDNSQKGRVSGGDELELKATRLTNHDGSIGSARALTASVTALDQQSGRLFSNTSLTLDLNGGELNNQGGLINAPGTLLLKNLTSVLNQNGEISSAEAFTLSARSLDNSAGKLLSNNGLTLRIAEALNNVKGTIASAGLDVSAGSLENSGGSLISRNDLRLTSSGLVNNRDQGLINSAGALGLAAAGLDSGNGGEVSAHGNMTLALNALSLDAGRLIGDAAVSIDLANGDLNNQAGLITATGPLTFGRLRDLYNQGGEISSDQSFLLSGRTLNNSGGKIISSNLLTLRGDSLINQTGLLSGWQGLTATGGSLDNRNTGTVSSRYGNVGVDLSGALLNGSAGALVSQQALTVSANSLDNSNGNLSSGAGQTLTVAGRLNNAQNGLIDSGAGLVIKADELNNAAGNLTAQQDFILDARLLDNSAGNLSSKGAMTLDLLGQLVNTQGKLASGGALLLRRSAQVLNQGGQLVSQTLMTLNTGALDNSNRGTLAANGQLVVAASGHLDNSADGLIYSQNADLRIKAASLGNARGAVQSQTGASVEVNGDIDDQSGRIIAQNGDLNLTAANLDSRGGVLSSQQGGLTANLAGTLNNGLDTAGQGGVIQAQRLNLSALAGLDNSGGRISARSGEALLTTANFSNRNGGLYGKGLLRVIAQDFDNGTGGQVAASQIDLRLNGVLSNQTGIVESDTSLAVTASRIDNQNGRLRALGTGGKTDFQIGSLFDNRNGTLDVASNDLTLNAASFLNGGGSLLHTGNGTFDISTANLTNAGGSIVTQGGLTLSADSWTNSSVIQAGRLTVNVGTLNQTASGQLLASSLFSGTGGNWTNGGLIASSGASDIRLSGTYAGNGRLTSQGNLTLNAAQLTLADANALLAAGGTATIGLAGSLVNSGRITGNAGMQIDAATVSNMGTLGAGGALTLTASNLLNDNALIFSGGDASLRVGDFTNLKGDVYSLGDLRIARDAAGNSGNSIINRSGTLSSDGNMLLSANSIQNIRDVLTVDNAGIVAAQINEIACGTPGVGSLDCSGKRHHVWEIQQHEKLAVTAATQASQITAGGNLTLQGGDFLNSSSIVATSRDLTAQVNNFSNAGVVVGESSTNRVYISQRTRNAGIWYELSQNFNDKYSSSGASYDAARLSGLEADLSQFISITEREVDSLRTTTQISSGDQSYSGTIQAGGAVNIRANNNFDSSVVRPGFTYVSGGQRTDTTAPGGAHATIVTLSPQLPPDLAQQQVNPLSLPGFSLPTGQNGLFRLSGQAGTAAPVADPSGSPQNWTIGSAAVSLSQREQMVPTVQAGTVQIDSVDRIASSARSLAQVARRSADLSISASAFDTAALGGSPAQGSVLPVRSPNVRDYTQLDTVTAVAAGHTDGSLTAAPRGTPVTSNEPVMGTGGQTAANPSAPLIPAAAQTVARVEGLPSSAAVSQPHKYLIETNPALTELKQFMSSDYLLSKLGYDPDQSARRLGDGLYEQRLVQQAVVARTGQAFLAGQTSNEDQFRYLMNNAIASKQELNLRVGVSLDAQQVAALTHDIVWLEEHEVNGQKVLVPVLYLAHADNRLAPTGALIAGNDLSLIAGQNLTNVGTLKATNNLSASAGNDLVNSGLIQAGNRLDLLAGNDLTNKAGGIIAGRDVTLNALNGDIVNERTVVSHQSAAGNATWREDFADSAARIEAANDLTLQAGRDVANTGGVLQAGRDLSLSAGRDIVIASAQDQQGQTRGTSTRSDITQLGASVSVGRDLSAEAGRDISAIASRIDAGRDIAMTATEDLTLSSAADEQHSYSKSKKITAQEDHVSQVATDLEAGSRVTLQAGKDLAAISSRITAGAEAYLVAGDQLNLLAAQDSDYSLYDYKKKGSFGSKKTQRDAVTDVRNVGSEIKTGGDLLLVSGGDQTYQAARLESGEDLTLQSGGAVTFEGVKDLHQESHEKSKSSSVWFSNKGKGKTDETLRQSELTAQGNVLIQAVNGLHVDVKQISQESVSQSIDAMVKADPKLAWLKEVEQRGDVDWRQVKEIHDSFKYSNSGLGPAAQLIIAIVMVAVVGPMAAAAAGGGVGGAMVGAVAANASTNATVSTINNRGDLGAVFKDVTSSSAMKGYLTSAAMAGIMPGYNPAELGFDLGSAQTVLMKSASDAFVNTVINGGSYSDNLGNALAGQATNIGMAVGFKLVGDWALGKYQDGSPQKVMAHALMGGLLAEATGGDFKTGAIAAGANEALIADISTMVGGDKNLELMVSQLTGLIAAAAVGGDMEKGAQVANYATTYNRQLHLEEQKWLEDNAQAFADKQGITKQAAMERLSQQALKETDMLWRSVLSDGTDASAQAFLASSGQTFTNELGNKQALFTAQGNQLFRPEMFADTTSPAFYKQFVQSGISRDLSAGLVKELRDSGVALKDSAADLVAAATANPGAAVEGLLKGIQELPQSVVDGFRESGAALGEGAAVAFSDQLSAKLNAIYGVDVGAAQQSLLLVRTVSALVGAGAGGKVADALTAKLDDVLAKSVAKAESGKGTRDLADIDLGAPGPCCFAAGTKVSTPQGDRAIDQLRVGDIVWSKPEKGGKPFAARILATHVRNDQPIYRLKLKSVSDEGSTETLLVTPGHPFYVPAKNGFIPVIDLKLGDRLQSLADGASENTSSEVESLELYASEGTTYNLTVDVGHTFYVGNLKTWVHNTGPCALPERGGVEGANDVGETAYSAVKPTVDLFGGKNAQTPGAINVDISADIQSGIRADARQLPFKDGSVGEIVATNPFIPKEAGGTFSMMDYLPEATRVVEPGGKIFINANAANPYGKLPSASDLESLGVRIVQDGPLDSRFSGQTFLRTDGSIITNLDSMKTIVLEKIK